MAVILVVEDAIDVAKVLARRLTDCGYKTCVANDPGTGAAMAVSEKPDLILLDLKLPEGGGLSMLKRLKTSEKTREIPIVVVSGVRDVDAKNNALKEGAEAFIEKPYQIEELKAVIRGVLEKRGKI